MRTQCLSLGVMCLVTICCGCGGNSDLASVTGTVTLDGKPLENAQVTFAPTTAGTTSYGRTNSNGEYEMLFSDSEKGAWLGENLVRITTADVGTGDSPGRKEIVPSVYNQETKLKAVVEKKANVFDFELESKAGKVKQSIRE